MEAFNIYPILRRHLRSFFAGHASEEHIWTLGPVFETLPRLRVAEFAPGPRFNGWVYNSIGASEVETPSRLEFFITAPAHDLQHVELVALSAWYHQQYGLGVGHTYPIGEPWLPGSECEFILVSIPYPFGPSLELCPLPDGCVQYCWLLPITRREREFKIEKGQEALEQRFDECGLEYWDPLRASVV